MSSPCCVALTGTAHGTCCQKSKETDISPKSVFGESLKECLKSKECLWRESQRVS